MAMSDNPKRIFNADFSATINTDLLRFGELQFVLKKEKYNICYKQHHAWLVTEAHRRIIGFIGVVQAPTENEKEVTSQQISDVDTVEDRRVNVSNPRAHFFAEIKEQYDFIKVEYASTVVDSRCVVIGYPEESIKALCSSRELFYFKSLDDADSLEIGIRDFLRSIYYVLESRRLDLSFEKLEFPPCLALIDEQKYRQGLENKTSKIYRLVSNIQVVLYL
ncbi:unnamed protein product [Brugia timori]|uniref:Acetyltransf_18 domain-containing protein n=1 Tax=Brugia timori TaxID=42155 RepID=A0A0R3Q6N6_9BILA|nr:unnamed protein product [Brugia timori]